MGKWSFRIGWFGGLIWVEGGMEGLIATGEDDIQSTEYGMEG